ncbi:hypothetical protein BC830DRAFT_215368 [Chytriomyces sp. MP71]|nr:hypothetical protein BC830DRAFT_215368 [Chytriomyces sp. MP71]
MTSDVTDVPIPILKIQNATLVDSASSGNTSASLASKALANLQNSTNIGLFTNATSVAVTTTAAILASSTPGVTPMLGLGSQAPIATDSASASGPNRFFCSLPQSMPTFEQLACPITQISAMQDLALGRDTSLNNWLSFVSQIGFINAHALLCVGGIVLAICSLAVTLKSYSRLTASLDWNAFSAFQKGHLIFHVASTLYFLLFLCGFVTYLLNIPRAWVILAALCEFLVYGIQIILCFLTTRSTSLTFPALYLTLHQQNTS